MRFHTFLAVLASALGSCATPSFRSPQREERPPVSPQLAVYGRQVTFGAGVRSFEDEGFGALDDQVAWTLDYCEPMELGALRLEGGMHYTYDDASGTAGGQDVRLESKAFELSVGVNLAQLWGRVRPYAGVGVSLLFLELRGIDDAAGLVFDDDDLTVGGYAKAGLLFQVTRTSHLGLELRHFEGGSVSLDGTDLDTSYDQLLLLFGTSFE
jgi:hypothetical protein